MGLSQQFIDVLASLRFEQLGDAGIKAAKERCIDYLGALGGGVRQGPLAQHMLKDLAAKNSFSGESAVLGTKFRTTAPQAALINGVTGHALELDDGDRRSYGHPAVIVFSTLFPLAESLRSSGKDFLLATAVGYEAYARLGQACNPGMLRRGFHTTGAVGSLATAMAASVLLGLSKEKMLNALGVAALFSSGLSITFNSGATLKPLNAGRAAFNGVTAALMALMGAEGAPDILEGKNGFFHAYSGQDIDESILLAPHAAPLAVERSYVKFYPACRYTHAPIDAALALRDKVDLHDVRDIVVTTYPTAIYLAAKTELPTDMPSSRFNIGFAVGLALTLGQPSVADFNPERAADPLLRDLFGKVRFVEDAAYDSAANNIRGASMTITTGTGSFSVDVPLPVGEPENPAPPERFAAKFADLAGGVWDGERQEDILEAVNNMENMDDMRDMACLLATGI